jgi:hypothetical protein
MFCGCGMGLGLLKNVRAKDIAREEPILPQGPRFVSVDQSGFNKIQHHHQLAQLLHPLRRSSIPELLREKVFEPTPKSTNIVAEKVV